MTTGTPRFQLSEVRHDAPEFEELIACEATSFNNPPQSIFRLFYPIFGTEPEEDKQTALKNLVQLQQQWSRDDPDAVWCKVVDIEQNDKIVGGILFKVHRDNPFARHGSGSTQQSATWYPAGSQREYIDECLRMLTAPHERFMQRAHVYAYIGFVLPEYRQRGILDMLLGEVCRRADEFGMEVWLESVIAMGVPIYMRHGFVPFRKLSIEPKMEAPDDEWSAIEKKMQPLRFWPMWRPSRGKFAPAETIPPWNEFMDGMMSRL